MPKIRNVKKERAAQALAAGCTTQEVIAAAIPEAVKAGNQARMISWEELLKNDFDIQARVKELKSNAVEFDAYMNEEPTRNSRAFEKDPMATMMPEPLEPVKKPRGRPKTKAI